MPAPTAWTEADAPPPRIRIAISIPIFVLIALNTENTTKRLNEMMYIVRRPNFSEKEDLADVKLRLSSIVRGLPRHLPPKWKYGHGKHIEGHRHVDDSIGSVKITGYISQGGCSMCQRRVFCGWSVGPATKTLRSQISLHVRYMILEPIGPPAAANATMRVMSHFVFLE